MNIDIQKTCPVQLRPAAVVHVRSILANQPNSKGLRIGVKKAGCSGFAYVLGIAESVLPGDTLYPVEDLTIVVDDQSFSMLQGVELDCVEEGLNRFLKFYNPNATGECGCGESFSIRGA